MLRLRTKEIVVPWSICYYFCITSLNNPANFYLFKRNTRNTRKRCENMFKVNNKNTRTTSLTLFWCFYCELWTYLTSISSVSIVGFEQVTISWENLGSCSAHAQILLAADSGSPGLNTTHRSTILQKQFIIIISGLIRNNESLNQVYLSLLSL